MAVLVDSFFLSTHSLEFLLLPREPTPFTKLRYFETPHLHNFIPPAVQLLSVYQCRYITLPFVCYFYLHDFHTYILCLFSLATCKGDQMPLTDSLLDMTFWLNLKRSLPLLWTLSQSCLVISDTLWFLTSTASVFPLL